MRNTSGTPFDDGPDAGLLDPQPLAEFLSESEIEFQTVQRARTWDELELLAVNDVAAPAFGARRPRSVGLTMMTSVAVIGILAGGLTRLMVRDRTMASGEPRVRPAVSAAVSPSRPVPVVPHGAAAAMTVTERLPSRTNSRVRGGQRSNSATRSAVVHGVSAARAVATSAQPSSTSNDAQALPAVVPARASLLLAPVATSPTANPVIPTSLPPADVRVSATASDPDGDALTYRWEAPVGRFANATERETVYTCPDTPTTVELILTVTDRHGGFASDVLTVHCVDRR